MWVPTASVATRWSTTPRWIRSRSVLTASYAVRFYGDVVATDAVAAWAAAQAQARIDGRFVDAPDVMPDQAEAVPDRPSPDVPESVPGDVPDSPEPSYHDVSADDLRSPVDPVPGSPAPDSGSTFRRARPTICRLPPSVIRLRAPLRRSLLSLRTLIASGTTALPASSRPARRLVHRRRVPGSMSTFLRPLSRRPPPPPKPRQVRSSSRSVRRFPTVRRSWKAATGAGTWSATRLCPT